MTRELRLYDLKVMERQAVEANAKWYGTLTALGEEQGVLAWFIAIPRLGIGELYKASEHSMEDVQRRVHQLLADADPSPSSRATNSHARANLPTFLDEARSRPSVFERHVQHRQSRPSRP